MKSFTIITALLLKNHFYGKLITKPNWQEE